jgi:hypothetical protein
MRKLLMVVLLVFSGFSYARVKAPLEQPARFDFRSLGISEVVQLIYSEALPGSYVIDPEVLNDQRLVSFRYEGGKDGVRAFIDSFFDSLGLVVVHRGSVDFIGRKVVSVPVLPHDEVFVYRPRFRDGSYLVEMLAPLFKGAFTSKRAVRAATGEAAWRLIFLAARSVLVSVRWWLLLAMLLFRSRIRALMLCCPCWRPIRASRRSRSQCCGLPPVVPVGSRLGRTCRSSVPYLTLAMASLRCSR